MRDRAFADTNIMLYAFSSSDTEKVLFARKVLDEFTIVVSTQVLREFANVAVRKLGVPAENVEKQINHIAESATVVGENLQSILSGLEIFRTYGLNFYDSLIVASALGAGCGILLSEDMQHGQRIAKTLTIVNPFLAYSWGSLYKPVNARSEATKLLENSY